MNDLASAIAAFRTFVDRCDRARRAVILHDSDADGVTSGVILQRALERLGFAEVVRVIPDRSRDAWSESNRERVRAADPHQLLVLDLGSRGEPVVDGVPTCLIDHHHPDGIPPGATLISAYSWDPIPNTSLLTYELCNALVDVSDLDWIAAMGAISDLGERAPFPLIGEAKKKHSGSALKEVTTLINAARRASMFDPERAARVLLAHDSPASVLAADDDDLRSLHEARAEVNGAMQEGKKAAPAFSKNVALVRIRSQCQIHPLIAQIWRTRLPKYFVLVANDGYLPGRVNFSARSSGDMNALQMLRAIDLPGGEGSLGHGHDQATGGSLPTDRWNALLAALGFDAKYFAGTPPD